MSLIAVAVDGFHRLRAGIDARAGALAPGRRITAIAIGVALVLTLVGVVLTLRFATGASAPPAVALPRARSDSGAPGTSVRGAAVAADAHSPGSAGGTVTVHAAGAVARSGVYELPAGSRVAALVAAAGGPVGDADIDSVNLAARLEDGQRIYVPHRGEAVPANASAPGASAPLDLNSATLEQLDALPGVGPSTAQAILDYRKKRGRFRSVDELLDVRGIGASKLAGLKKRVRV
jgi:competence protein ComEA